MRLALVAYHASIHTRRWAAWFAARGHDVHVVTVHGAPNFQGDPAEVPTGDEPYTVHDVGNLTFGKLSYLLLIPRVKRALKQIDPDVVHAHFVSSCGIQAWASGVRPLVCTGHGDDLLLAPRNPILKWMIGRTLRESELTTVPSAEMSSVVEELAGGKVKRPVEVLQYGVEVNRLAQLGDTARADRDDPDVMRIICARAMLQYCYNDVLVRALAELPDGRAWHCDIIGEGPEFENVKALAAELGVADRITFHGKVLPDVIEGLLAKADVYVSLASRDGASIALLEALSMGSYPVLSDIPSNTPWVEHGTTGEIVPIDPENDDAPSPNDVRNSIVRAFDADRTSAAASNRAKVLATADRDTNLGHIETRIEEVLAELGAPRRPS